MTRYSSSLRVTYGRSQHHAADAATSRKLITSGLEGSRGTLDVFGSKMMRDKLSGSLSKAQVLVAGRKTKLRLIDVQRISGTLKQTQISRSFIWVNEPFMILIRKVL